MASKPHSNGSVALFLATAGLVASSGSAFTSADARAASFNLNTSSLLAQATQECVPIGEGENCAKPRRKKKKSNLIQQETNSGATPNNPAANDSNPTPNPGAQSGSSQQLLNQIERGDL